MLTLLVPVLPDLRKIPAFSKRPPNELPSAAAFCTWNNPPGRLVMTAPPLTEIPPAPLQRIVPALSSVRVLRDAELRMAALSVQAGAMIVRPLPFMVPPVQF